MLHIIQAIDACPEGSIGSWSGQEPSGTSPKTLAQEIRACILQEEVTMMACMVHGVPLMPAGPLRPVKLPCCLFIVSSSGAQKVVQSKRCPFCKASLHPAAVAEGDESLANAVFMEIRGFQPQAFKAEHVKVGRRMGSGEEGSVFEGRLKGRPVAVKKVRLPTRRSAEQWAILLQAISVQYSAGLTSTHICKLYGYCRTDSELWCARLSLSPHLLWA